jgi:hypothetical protein
MHDGPLNKILLIIVVILVLGEGYLLYQNAQLKAAAPQGGTEAAGSASSSASVVAPTNILVPLNGTIEGVSGSTITLEGQASSTVQVVVSSDTTIVQEGALLDAATYEAELEKFHEESDQLLQNAQQNQAALETLIAPSRNVETPISLSQLSPGEEVSVFAVGQAASGAYEAYKVMATPTVQ